MSLLDASALIIFFSTLSFLSGVYYAGRRWHEERPDFMDALNELENAIMSKPVGCSKCNDEGVKGVK